MMSEVIGQLLLDRGGVLLMTTPWCAAVGVALLPLRHRHESAWVVVGPSIGLILTLPMPFMVPTYLVALVLTAAVMGPATFLISMHRSKTLVRAVVLVAASAILLWISPMVPNRHQWITMLLFPLVMFGLPVGLMLTLDSAVGRKGWHAGLASAMLFVTAWAVWMGRNHYYRAE
jgi:hypothetical protein